MKVLVVDDDRALRTLMCEMLRKGVSAEVVEAGDGVEAWEALDSGLAVDLCIVDMRMPRSGGLDLLAKMRQDARLKHQKVIFCSGVNERSAVLQTAALGISAYLLKPFAIEGFLDRVRRVYNTTPKKNSPQEEQPAETPETVIKRLGIGLSVYQKLIEMFTNDVDELVATLRNASQLELKQEIEVKLCAINGASRTLGATGLAKLVEQLERAWTAGDEAALNAIIPLIGLENMKVAAAARDMTG